jgi:hypothetical protein
VVSPFWKRSLVYIVAVSAMFSWSSYSARVCLGDSGRGYDGGERGAYKTIRCSIGEK